MVLIVTVIFDLLPAVDQTMIGFYQDLFLETLLYAGFAFVLNLGREWIKDCQDMNGDRAGGRSTLPLVIGKARTQKLTAVLLLVAAIGVGFIVTVYFYQYSWIVYPLVYGIIAPLMYISLRLWQIKTNKELTLLSLILKVTMLLGILSMILVAKIPINA
jgi:4-hydroxybenzoate polyprenyltransferase